MKTTTTIKIFWSILFTLLIVGGMDCQGQWKANIGFAQDKMIHTNPGGENRIVIHTDNVWTIGVRKKDWVIALHKSGHDNWFIYSNPSHTVDGKQKRNRNATGFYFQHSLVRFNRLSFNVGHRLLIIGDDHGEGLFKNYIPVGNMEYEFKISDQTSFILKSTLAHRYRCVVLGLGGSLTF